MQALADFAGECETVQYFFRFMVCYTMKELQTTMVYSWFEFLEIMHGYVCVTQRGNRNGPLLMARVGLTKF